MKVREDRHKVLIRARMRVAGASSEVCVRDISERGLLIQSFAALSRGTYVEIFLGARVIVGRVIWSNERRSGIQTQDRLDLARIVPRSSAEPAQSSLPASSFGQRATPVHTIERAENSRRQASLFQFGAAILFGGLISLILAELVRSSFWQNLSIVSKHLPG